jgi:hypothetical protein
MGKVYLSAHGPSIFAMVGARIAGTDSAPVQWIAVHFLVQSDEEVPTVRLGIDVTCACELGMSSLRVIEFGIV